MPVLDYRSPSATSIVIRRALRHRETLRAILLVAKLLLALPLTVIGPSLVAAIIHSIAQKHWRSDLSYFTTFILCSLAIIPLLFWLELRTRGRFFENKARAIHADHSPMYPVQP